MTRDQAVVVLKVLEPKARAYGVTGLCLFGSTARNEADDTSDIDVLIEFDPASQFSAFRLARLKTDFEAEIGVTVDVATRGGLDSRLLREVERDSVRVF